MSQPDDENDGDDDSDDGDDNDGLGRIRNDERDATWLPPEASILRARSLSSHLREEMHNECR